MKTHKIPVEISFELPENAWEWELYSSKDPDKLAECVEEMNRAVMDAIADILNDNLRPSAAFNKRVAPIQSKYAELGANDTEPRSIACAILRHAYAILRQFSKYD